MFLVSAHRPSEPNLEGKRFSWPLRMCRNQQRNLFAQQHIFRSLENILKRVDFYGSGKVWRRKLKDNINRWKGLRFQRASFNWGLCCYWIMTVKDNVQTTLRLYKLSLSNTSKEYSNLGWSDYVLLFWKKRKLVWGELLWHIRRLLLPLNTS